jgi:hypothetical protein
VVRHRLLVLRLVVTSEQLDLIGLDTTMSAARVDPTIRAASLTHASVGASGNGRWSANIVRRVGERRRH